MQPKIKEDILKVLDRALEILEIREEKDILELSELSNHIVHNASIYQDEDSVSVAVLIYSIFKVIERPSYLEQKYYTKIIDQLEKSRDFLRADNIQNYRKEMKRLFSLISTIDKKIKLYIQEVIDKARITKGSKIFAHGISLGRVAELLNVSQWELMNYIGKTQIFEKEPFKLDVKKRLNFARGLFK
ncbi:hypothetical protein KY330_01635 [Candidatus Woesearchaeota archaeon]|nr:hypothetical protein [Candidatus Woesearchaeota archaeon]